MQPDAVGHGGLFAREAAQVAQFTAVEDVEDGQVAGLVGGDPVAAAVRTGPQRHAFGLGAEAFARQVGAGVVAGQVVDAQRGAHAQVFFGDKQAVVHCVAGDRLDHAQGAGLGGVAEVALVLGFQAAHRRQAQAEAFHALVQLVHRRQGFGAVIGHEAVGHQQLQLARRGFVQPQAVGAAQHVLADHRHRFEVGQAQHLHAVVVAFDHEHQVGEHRDAVGPVELPRAVAAFAENQPVLAVVTVEDHQLVAFLAGGDQPGVAFGRGPAGHRVDLVLGHVRAEESLGHRHRIGAEDVGHRLGRRVRLRLRGGHAGTAGQQQGEGEGGKEGAHGERV